MAAVRRQAFRASAPAGVVGERELMRRRLLRALEKRQRYRYVQPTVTITEEGWLVTSPCCSRNVDPDGGVIDIARLARDNGHWQLFSRDDTRRKWLLQASSARFEEVMDALLRDRDRVFWP